MQILRLSWPEKKENHYSNMFFHHRYYLVSMVNREDEAPTIVQKTRLYRQWLKDQNEEDKKEFKDNFFKECKWVSYPREYTLKDDDEFETFYIYLCSKCWLDGKITLFRENSITGKYFFIDMMFNYVDIMSGYIKSNVDIL